jgi:DNA-binding transcriptional regulator YdaS (Cro superfamily)
MGDDLPNGRKADDEVVTTKKRFAALANVSPSRVSQWIAKGQLSGEAIVGHGHRARIRVAVAKEQLRRNLDVVQHLGAAGRARLDGNGAAAASTVEPTVEDDIKQARLQQLALSNAKARAEAAAQSGRYLLAADARQELGRVAARLMAAFESSFTEFANAIMAAPPATSRDALRTLRAIWWTIRARQAKAAGAEAVALPPLVDDEVDDADSERTAASA